MRLLNLGCGHRFCSSSNWVNVDKKAKDGVRVHDLLEPLPFGENKFDVVYHSHLLEHFPKRFVPLFLKECWRVLKPGGILRVAVPDLEEVCRAYLAYLQAAKAGDKWAVERYDWIVVELLDQLTRHRPGGEMLEYWKQNPMPAEEFVIGRLGDVVRKNLKKLRASSRKPSLIGYPFPCEKGPKMVGRFRLGGQPHLWMYDEFSLKRLLRRAGFCGIRRCGAGESQIPDFDSYQLDIDADGKTRKPDSLFLEAKPG